MLLHARLAEPADPDAVAGRLAATVARFPHLGAPPAVRECPPGGWPAMVAGFADRPYEDGAPLIRAAAGGDPPALLLAVHHGATDGLGLLGLLGTALGTEVSSGARGIGDRPASRTFLGQALCRLAEALFTPPARIAPTVSATASTAASTREAGDTLLCEHLPARRAGTAELIAATARAAQRWNRERGSATTRAVAGVGVSRRDGHRPCPVADSAFVRLRLPADPSAAAVRGLLAGRPPEPDVPPSASGRPWLPVRLLAARLGATFLASNLGIVQTDAGVQSLAFYPTASGRSGVSVGAATAGATTTVTLRARRADFDGAAAERLLAAVVDELSR